MRLWKNKDKKTKKFIAVAAVSFFNIFASAAAVFAWFEAIMHKDVTSGDFIIVNKSASLDNVKLYKFNYAPTIIGSYVDYEHLDYNDPTAEGAGVYKYDYSIENNSFGYVDENEDWEEISVMNVYDPVEFVINANTELKDLNCGVVYEITVQSNDIHDATIDIKSSLIEGKTKTRDQIFLSDCIEFHAYFESDLENLTNKSLYYPTSYIPTTEDLTDEEEVYYKLAYLFSVDTNPHFYGQQTKPSTIVIDNTSQVSFTNGYFTFYIFANYAQSELLGYHTAENLTDKIRAVYDYYFTFAFGDAQQ